MAPNLIHHKRIASRDTVMPPFGEQVFYISMSEIEAIVKPNGITNDVGWESVAFICVHEPILPKSAL